MSINCSGGSHWMSMPRSRQSLRLGLVTIFLASLTCGLFITKAEAADKYRAFYYDSQGQLLQVEEVLDTQLASRTLLVTDWDEVPKIARGTREKKSGASLPMSRLAVIAVYYTYDGAEPPVGSQNVRARPVFVEDLSFIGTRTIPTCIARSGNDPCIYPQRCHCQTGACCCW